MRKHVQNGTYNAPIKPELYDLDQDFDSVHNRNLISKGLDCFNPDEKEFIEAGNDKFKNDVFGYEGDF